MLKGIGVAVQCMLGARIPPVSQVGPRVSRPSGVVGRVSTPRFVAHMDFALGYDSGLHSALIRAMTRRV